METLTIIGSIASIGSACWASYKAYQSKTYATEAKDARDQLILRRDIAEVSILHHETQKILKLATRIGPTCIESDIRGIKTDKIAKDIEKYSQLINEHKIHFSEINQNHANNLCTSLSPLIESFSYAKDISKRKKYGKEIYYLLFNFSPIVKNLSDNMSEEK